MISKDILPSEQLRQYISQYRLRHFIFQKGMVPPVKPFPPRPEQCLTFYIRGNETARYLDLGSEIRKPRSVLSGQFTNRVDRYVSFPEILMIIVDFKPGALNRLVGIPFTAFTNRDLDAETVFCTEIKRVNERLSSSECYGEMIQIIERFFAVLIQQQRIEILPLDGLITRVSEDPDCSIDWMAKHAFLSPRQLERKFDERIGISPKTFLRISRFNKSYWLHLKNPGMSWFDIAMSCGYTDYQHLVKEYKEFTHAAPNPFFELESRAPGRILGLTKY